MFCVINSYLVPILKEIVEEELMKSYFPKQHQSNSSSE